MNRVTFETNPVDRMRQAARSILDAGQMILDAQTVPSFVLEKAEPLPDGEQLGDATKLVFCAECAQPCLIPHDGSTATVFGIESAIAEASGKHGFDGGMADFVALACLEGRLPENVLFSPYQDLLEIGMDAVEEPREIPSQVVSHYLLLLTYAMTEKIERVRTDVFVEANNTRSTGHDEAATVMGWWAKAAEDVMPKMNSQRDVAWAKRLQERCEAAADAFTAIAERERERDGDLSLSERRRVDAERHDGRW